MRGQFPIHVLVVALLCVALGAPSLSRGQAAAPCDDECLQARRTAAGAKGFPEAGPPVLLEGADGASADKLAAQFEALSSIENASVHYDARGVPRFISGKTTFLVPNDLKLSDSGEVLAPVIAGLRSLLLAEGTETLSVESVGRKHLLRGTGVVLRQSIRGIPVTDAQIVLTTDERTQRVIRISAHFLPDRGLAREPQISAEEASSRAFAWVREFKTLSDNPLTYRDGTRDVRTEDAHRPSFLIDEVTLGAPPQLAYIIGRAHVSSDARLTWQVELHRNESPFKGLVIDAVDGSVIAARDRRVSAHSTCVRR